MHDSRTHSSRQRHRHWTTGLILITVGSLFLLERWGILEPRALRQYWPAVIALVGLVQIIGSHHAAQRVWGGFLVFLAAWLYASIEHLWELSFRTSWPLILIALGVTQIVGGLAGMREEANPERPS